MERNFFLFIEFTELNWNGKYEHGLCVYIFLKDMGWYLGVAGKINNYECIIYICTGKVIIGNTSIFNKSHYHCWYKELRNKISPVIIDTTPKNTHVYNHINGKIPRNGVIDKKTINTHDFCYQCSKDGTDFYLEILGLGIVNMNHISCKFFIIMSNQNEKSI